MSLLMKKRQQESQRNNGLNDPNEFYAREPQPMKSQNMSVNSWPTMNNKTPAENYPVTSHPVTMNHQQLLPSSSKFKDDQDLMKSLLQQAYQRPSIKGKKTNVIPSWSIPTTSTMPYETMNFMNPKIIDNKLPAGAYYEEAPVYVDPTTSNPMTFESTPSTVAASANTSTDAENLAQSNRCMNSNCSKCKNSVEAN